MPGDQGSTRDRQGQEVGATPTTAAADLVPAAQRGASGGKAPGAKRHKQDFVRQLIPAWYYPKAVAEKDASWFAKYNSDISALVSSAETPDKYGTAILAASQRLYDDGLARRESINTRCGAVLSTGGILGALFVAAGQLGLMQQKGSYGIAAWIVLVLFIIALAYVGFSIVMALAVQAALRGNVVDPGDLVISPSELNPDEYAIHLAKRYLFYTVQNYKVNNELMFQLHSAQRCLRNGIVAIILAGMLSPLALHMAATSGTSTPSSGSSVARLLISNHSANISSRGVAMGAFPPPMPLRIAHASS
jgi:hypothetical protein